jgi:predicted AAA+ superfamily ATPase
MVARMKWHYKPRWLAERLREAISFSPIVVLTGARQTGKSTLLQQESPFKSWRYLNLDDLDVLAMANRRPEELCALSNHLVIDEVQRSPGLLLAVKRAVDKDRRKRFVLSGSANLLLMKKVSESLAGRALYFDLLPFSWGEETEADFPQWPSALLEHKPVQRNSSAEPLPDSSLFRGSIPPVTFLSKETQISAWWNGYIRTYLERDLRDLSQITNLPDFRKMMGLLAMRCGQILKQSEIARDAGLSHSTAGRYINLLEISGLLVKLKPYTKNISKRIVKSPKVYFIDPGLVCALAGFKRATQIPNDFKGALFESFVFLNLLAYASMVGGDLYYFRTQGGKEKEIDFILEMNGNLIAIEAKYSSRVGFRDAKNLFFLKELLPNFAAGLVIYNGPEALTLGENIYAVPWFWLAQPRA